MKLLLDFIDFYQEQDYIIFWSVSVSVLITLFIIFLWVINFQHLPQELPLFYSLPWGDAQLGNTGQFIILPSTVLLITLTNLIISWHLHPSQIVVKRILSFSSVVIALLFLISAIKIIFTFV